MIIYRFEKNGIGPYVGNLSLMVNTLTANTGNKHATKKAMRIRMENHTMSYLKQWQEAHSDKSFLFGCPSKDMLRAYFGYRFKPLFASGYRIKKFDVPDDEVIKLGIEVAFPVQYHKLRTKKRLRAAVSKVYL